jgi:protein-tyrosine phosphatase
MMTEIRWAIPNLLARSSRPGYSFGRTAVDQATVDAWLAEAHDAGIKSIICLLADEHLKLYQDLPPCNDLIEYYRSKGFEVAHIPVLDYQDPPLSDDDMQQVVAAYKRLPKPVLVHCSAGIDRTGQAVAHLKTL